MPEDHLTGTQLVASSAGTDQLTFMTQSKGGTTIAGYTFAYDAANRITGFVNTQHSDETVTVNYDASGQLMGAERTGTADDEAYDYDGNGNRETANGATYTTTANNRLASDGTYSYEYDAEGNRTKQTNIATGDYSTFAWDHRNRLVAVTDFDDQDVELQRVEYAYDLNQRLVGRQVFINGSSNASESQHFVYDGNQMTLVMDDAGNVEHRMLWGPAVDQIFADENGAGDLFWMLTDNQNTVRDIAEYDAGTDTTTVANHIAFSSFGEKQSETNGALDVLSLEYTARYTDPLTGLQWNLNRWYDPGTGKWLSEDPIGFVAEDPNLFRYAKNAPLMSVDPYGFQQFPNGTITVSSKTYEGEEFSYGITGAHTRWSMYGTVTISTFATSVVVFDQTFCRCECHDSSGNLQTNLKINFKLGYENISALAISGGGRLATWFRETIGADYPEATSVVLDTWKGFLLGPILGDLPTIATLKANDMVFEGKLAVAPMSCVRVVATQVVEYSVLDGEAHLFQSTRRGAGSSWSPMNYFDSKLQHAEWIRFDPIKIKYLRSKCETDPGIGDDVIIEA